VRKIGRWIGAVSLEGELLCCGGGPRAALYHLRTLTPMNPVGPTSSANSQDTGAVHFVDIFTDENKIAVGGEMENTLCLTNLSGDVVAEIETSSSCVYTVAHQSSSTRKLMTIAGSSSKIDLCTANFCYKDCTVNFPSATVC
jgi:THO complex subunit 6